MTISVITEQVTSEHQAVLMRFREKDASDNCQYDVKPDFKGKKRGWFVMDSMTAHAIQAVYRAINEDNRAKFDRISLPALVNVSWKAVA